MKLKTFSELSQCREPVYSNRLIHVHVLLERDVWQQIKEFAAANSTTAGEVLRAISRNFVKTKEKK